MFISSLNKHTRVVKMWSSAALKVFVVLKPAAKLNLDGKMTGDWTDCLVPFVYFISQPSHPCTKVIYSSIISIPLKESRFLLMEIMWAWLCSSGLNIMFTRPINTWVYENILHMKSWFCCRGRPRLTVVGTIVKINPVVSTAVATIIHPLPDSIKRLFIISGHNL